VDNDFILCVILKLFIGQSLIFIFLFNCKKHMNYQHQSFICLIRFWNFWSLYIHEMAEGYKKNKRTCESKNWPLYNLSTNTTSARKQEKGRERETIYMHSRRTAEKMDERTNGSTTNSPSFSSCYMCIDTLIAKRGRESDRRRIPLRQHSTHKFFLFIFSYAVLDDGVQKILFVVDGVESSPFFSSLRLPSSPTPSLTANTHTHV
jgi:hypothetical protein